jgi:hypothetical protein
MYLLYSDESGNIANPADAVFVVGGIAVHEDAVRPLAGEINGILTNFVGKRHAKIEIHGSPMRRGRGEWSAVGVAKRHALAHALLGLVANWQHQGSNSTVEPFAVVIDRNHSQSAIETAYGELLFSFDKYLRASRRQGEPHNGVLVADRCTYERALGAWVEVARGRYRRPQQDPRRLYALAETPFFVDSRTTRLMQLADLVAHAMFRAYNSADWSWAKTLEPGLSRDGEQRLLHLTGDKECSCPACRGTKMDALTVASASS